MEKKGKRYFKMVLFRRWMGLFSVFFKKIIDTGHKAFYNIKV